MPERIVSEKPRRSRPKMGSPLRGRALFGCDFIARPRRSAAATPSSSLFVSLEHRLGQMFTLFCGGPLSRRLILVGVTRVDKKK